MEIKEFCEGLLLAPSLEDKLYCPDILTDLSPENLIKTPNTPGRQEKISFSRFQGGFSFPSKKDFLQASARGVALHFFANHELLAIELMALALLKFTDASSDFRLGIVRTIKEEQGHMRLYLERMRELGVDFGDVPLNSFFWDALKNMNTPMDYVVSMGMTFEQANLDYSIYYRDLFGELNDKKTAEVLNLVYQEEIGHVKYGVHWFNKMKNSSLSDWDQYKDHLKFPLTPSRAKGKVFDFSGRRRADLSEDFIEHLFVHSQSRGRSPNLWLFNPSVEDDWVHPEEVRTLDKYTLALNKDYAVHLAFLAKKEDIVLCPLAPSVSHLKKLKEVLGYLPEFIDHKTQDKLASRNIASIKPWGKSPHETDILASYGFKNVIKEEPIEENRKFFSKGWSLEVLSKLYSEGFKSSFFGPADNNLGSIVKSINEIELFLKKNGEQHAMFVLKAPFGASGRHMQKLEKLSDLTAKKKQWVQSKILEQGFLIIEPWLDKISDFSVLLKVGDSESSCVRGITRFRTSRTGQYQGHFLKNMFVEWGYKDLQSIESKGGLGSLLRDMRKVGNYVALALREQGFIGYAGVDMMLYKTGMGDVCLKPIVEVNSRLTMGHIALKLERLLSPSSSGMWLHLSIKQIKKIGYNSFSDLAIDWSYKYPTVFKEQSGVPKLESGVLFINDSLDATFSLSCIIVNPPFLLLKILNTLFKSSK